MKKNREQKERLQLWQERLKRNETAFSGELKLMDNRERQYLGARELTQMVPGDDRRQTPHVRNISAELIEAQVDSTIPQPKVTARKQENEWRAKLIEDWLRNELDRMPFERLNDMMERTVPVQGGAAFHVEWDNSQRSHTQIGEVAVTAMHPKQLIPQEGVTSDVEEMDYFFLKIPQTKEGILRRYGVDVRDENEAEPDIRGTDEKAGGRDMVTQYIAYYRNEDGHVGRFSWVNDTVLEDMDDFLARRLRRCATCGATEPQTGEVEPILPTADGTWPGGSGSDLTGPFGLRPQGDGGTPAWGQAGPQRGRPAPRSRRNVCPYCGGTKWEEQAEDFEELTIPVALADGRQIGGMVQKLVPGDELDRNGMPIPVLIEEAVKVPYYKPDVFPVVCQKNVSVYGRFLGDSDLDKIADQQNTVNRIEAKIIDKLLTNGSYLSLPTDASIEVNAREGKVIRLRNVADKQLLGVYTMEGDVSQDMNYLAQTYEEARQIIGVTDSFQGRKDTTATSGKAKEFAAAQSAGRLESKRIMKNAAYAKLFEILFKFALAFADEPRPVVSHNSRGDKEYREFSRYEFLEQDEAGEWYWVDDFLFSCDTTAPLASNREAMWQETRMNLQTGAFGDPAQIQTLILFWTKMEQLHYPGAAETKSYLEEEAQRQQMMAQAQAMQQAMPQAAPARQEVDPEMARQVIEQARQDAQAAARGM